jgi:AcrR family transcriptional regulator
VTSKTASGRGEKRRSDILRAALALFNERGTAVVTTNHIAAHIGISVGNLYWHFRDKEAIIRALFEELRASFDVVWAIPSSKDEAFAAAVAALRRSFAAAWEYRFLYRELAALTQADPELKRLNVATRAKRQGEIRAFLDGLCSAGMLRFPDDETRDRVEELAWLLTAFWLPHVDLRDGNITKRAVLEGTNALLALFLPYATKEHAAALTTAIAERKEDR